MEKSALVCGVHSEADARRLLGYKNLTIKINIPPGKVLAKAGYVCKRGEGG